MTTLLQDDRVPVRRGAVLHLLRRGGARGNRYQARAQTRSHASLVKLMSRACPSPRCLHQTLKPHCCPPAPGCAVQLRSALVIFVSMLVPGVGVGNMVASMARAHACSPGRLWEDQQSLDLSQSLSTLLLSMPISLAAHFAGARFHPQQVLLQMAIFGGFLTNTADTPAFLNWLRYLSLFYYPFEARPFACFALLCFAFTLRSRQRCSSPLSAAPSGSCG